MIRLSRTVASSQSLVLYEDSDDPALLYFIPRFAELCHFPDGGPNFKQQTFRSSGAARTGVSSYLLAMRGVVPDAELAELADEMMEERRHPVRLEAVPVWMPSVGVTMSAEWSWAILACKARQRAGDFGEVIVWLVARDSAEPALAKQLMGSSGLEMSLEFNVTGATTPFRGVMQANFGAVQHHFLTTFSDAALVSWSQVTGEVETLLSNGMIRLRVESGPVDSSVILSAVSRRMVDRLFLLPRFPPKVVPHPGMHGAWFRFGERSEMDRWEAIDLVELDLETRALAVSSHIRSVPVEAFHGLNGAYQQVAPKMALHLAKQGIHLGDTAVVCSE